MNLGLVYLMIRSLRGRIVRTIGLVKQPKYLLGIIVFVAWIGFWVVGPVFFDDDRSFNVETFNAELAFELMGDALPAAHLLAALLVALFLSLWWLAPWSRMALNLTEAEIHILTPMPVKRRHLIQYATLKSQPGILFGCSIMTVFLGSGGPLVRAGWFLVFWITLTIWDLHSKGRSLWLERQKELPPAQALRNRLLLTVGIVVYWVVVGSAISSLWAELLSLRPSPGQETLDFVRQTLATYGSRIQSGVLGWLSLPFRWVTAPLFVFAPGVDPMLKLTGVATPLILLFGHNEWVVRSQTKFEEAALAHAKRESSKKQGARRYWKSSLRSRRRVSFALPPIGPPEIAIVWKNAMMVTRFSYVTLLLLALATIGLALLVSLLLASLEFVPFVIMSWGFIIMAMSPFTGAQNYRNDLRTDLTRVEMVRPWPIEGWKLFAAEAAGPTVFAAMTALSGAGLVLAMDLFMSLNRVGLAAMNGDENGFTTGTIAASLGVPRPLLVLLIVLGVAPMILAMTCLATTLQNLLVLTFPGWVQLGGAKQHGAAAFGQNMIMFFGLGLAGILCLLPAGLIIAAIIAVQTLLFGVPLLAWEFPVFGIIGATPVMAVVALIVRTGGRMWDNLDPSREILEGSA